MEFRLLEFKPKIEYNPVLIELNPPVEISQQLKILNDERKQKEFPKLNSDFTRFFHQQNLSLLQINLDTVKTNSQFNLIKFDHEPLQSNYSIMKDMKFQAVSNQSSSTQTDTPESKEAEKRPFIEERVLSNFLSSLSKVKEGKRELDLDELNNLINSSSGFLQDLATKEYMNKEINSLNEKLDLKVSKLTKIEKLNLESALNNHLNSIENLLTRSKTVLDRRPVLKIPHHAHNFNKTYTIGKIPTTTPNSKHIKQNVIKKANINTNKGNIIYQTNKPKREKIENWRNCSSEDVLSYIRDKYRSTYESSKEKNMVSDGKYPPSLKRQKSEKTQPTDRQNVNIDELSDIPSSYIDWDEIDQLMIGPKK